jgi:hypothetical protein
MKADIEVWVLSTPEELSRAGESTYVVLQRSVELSAAPFIGLQIGLRSNLEQNDRRLSRYAELMHQVSDNTAIFAIEHVIDFERMGLMLRVKEKYEPSAEKLRSYVELLTTFYGFRRSTDAT